MDWIFIKLLRRNSVLAVEGGDMLDYCAFVVYTVVGRLLGWI